MAGKQSTTSGIEVGGMNWDVTPTDELQDGRVLEMVSVEDFGSTPGYTLRDRTTVIQTDDGELHLKVERKRNQAEYTDSVTFKLSTLQAILDHVAAAPSEVAKPDTPPARKGWRNLSTIHRHL